MLRFRFFSLLIFCYVSNFKLEGVWWNWIQFWVGCIAYLAVTAAPEEAIPEIFFFFFPSSGSEASTSEFCATVPFLRLPLKALEDFPEVSTAIGFLGLEFWGFKRGGGSLNSGWTTRHRSFKLFFRFRLLLGLGRGAPRFSFS